MIPKESKVSKELPFMSHYLPDYKQKKLKNPLPFYVGSGSIYTVMK